MKKIIILILLISILPIFSAPAETTPKIEHPKTTEEAKEMGEEFIEEGRVRLPGILERIWKEEVLPFWRKMYEWWCHCWNSYIKPTFEKIWQKIISLFKKETEERKPVIEEEFQKEKEEIKEELPGVGKSLWERFKELLK